jgi:hypothetical protein
MRSWALCSVCGCEAHPHHPCAACPGPRCPMLPAYDVVPLLTPCTYALTLPPCRKMDDKVSGGGMTSDYILVSVIAAVDGTYRLPKITESADLKQGLVMMGGMAVDQVRRDRGSGGHFDTANEVRSVRKRFKKDKKAEGQECVETGTFHNTPNSLAGTFPALSQCGTLYEMLPCPSCGEVGLNSIVPSKWVTSRFRWRPWRSSGRRSRQMTCSRRKSS